MRITAGPCSGCSGWKLQGAEKMVSPQEERIAKEKLKAFMKDMYILLEKVALEKVEVEGEMYLKTLALKIKNAWKEFSDNHPLSDMLRAINNISVDQLRAHGLYGNQLRLKLAVIDVQKKRLFSFRTKAHLIKVLDSIDVLLESIVLVARIDTALRDMKDALKNSIDV
jgi:hypothetical protein